MARQPKFDVVRDGVRYRAFATRTEIEVLVGDGDIADPEAEVWVYPKVFGFDAAIAQTEANGRR